MEEVLVIGKWLEFYRGTCFGDNREMHFGIIVGIDEVRRIAVVAVNATSQIDKLIKFADFKHIPIEDATIDVTDDVHFSRPTGIDCHRPRQIPLEQLQKWVAEGKIRKTAYNEDVNPGKLHKLIEIMLRSPLITNTIKKIIRSSNQL